MTTYTGRGPVWGVIVARRSNSESWVELDSGRIVLLDPSALPEHARAGMSVMLDLDANGDAIPSPEIVATR
jgi:hypothetical protein